MVERPARPPGGEANTVLPRITRRALVAGTALAAGAGLSAAAVAAPRPDLWDRWLEHRPQSTAIVDFGGWSSWLTTYRRMDRDGVARIDYRAAVRDRDRVRRLIDDWSEVDVDGLDRTWQFAFWVNLYNLVTVDTVLEAYPVDSIRDIDISPGLFANGPWGAKLVVIAGEPLSLDDIEHRILRPIWNQDPRIHYAVNCAAIGCPNLAAEAFVPGNGEALLDNGARAYVNDPRGARWAGRSLTVSSIYRWFDEDFGGTEAGVLDHLRRYAAPDLAGRLAGRRGYDRTAYDWALNDWATTPGG